MKRSKEKSFTNVKQPTAVPSSGHFAGRVGEELREKILDLCRQVQAKSNGKKRFNPYQWVQAQVGAGKHPQAIVDGLEAVLKQWGEISKPWAYADSVVLTRSQNYREREHTAEAEGFKACWSEFLAGPEGQKLKGLLGRALARGP